MYIDEEEERKKQEMKEQASKELEEWYSQHKETIEKTRMSNRSVILILKFVMRRLLSAFLTIFLLI